MNAPTMEEKLYFRHDGGSLSQNGAARSGLNGRISHEIGDVTEEDEDDGDESTVFFEGQRRINGRLQLSTVYDGIHASGDAGTYDGGREFKDSAVETSTFRDA